VPDFSCGRSLYIDWRMVVVVEENVLHHVKKEGGECPEGYVRGGNVIHSTLLAKLAADIRVNRELQWSSFEPTTL